MLFARLRLGPGRLRLRAALVERRMHVVVLIVRANRRRVAIAPLIIIRLSWGSGVGAFVLRRHWVVMRSRLSWITTAIAAARCAAAIASIRRAERAEPSIAGRLIARLVVVVIYGRTLPVVPIGVLAGI